MEKGIGKSGFRAIVAAVFAGLAAACGSGSPTAPSPPPPVASTTVSIMGGSRLNAGQIVVWFNARQPRPPGSYAATAAVDDMARYFIEEGAAEGVTGDVAFMQSVVETGWFRFDGAVPAVVQQLCRHRCHRCEPGAGDLP